MFSLQCPGEFINKLIELQLFHDGTVNGNIQYYDMCKVFNLVNIAYNEREQFKIDKVTNNMIELSNPFPEKGIRSQISWQPEIIGKPLQIL